MLFPLWSVLLQVASLLLPFPAQVSHLWVIGASAGQILDCTNHSTSCSNPADSSSILSDTQLGCFSQDESLPKREFSFICIARASNSTSIQSDTGQQLPSEDRGSVSVLVETLGQDKDFNYGADLVLKCKFNTSLREDFRFRLRWMRLVPGSQGNQSIFRSIERRHETSSATNKLETIQREDSLDLELTNFQAGDLGSYVCQAHSADGLNLLNEATVNLGLLESTKRVIVNEEDFRNQYSLENLSKLLPSLKVIPSRIQATPGQQLQMACITSGTDPSPPDSLIEWSFAQMSQRESLLNEVPQFESHLPAGTDRVDNLLIIWSVTDAHTGLYKCHVFLNEFNLSVSAFGEIFLESGQNSSPQVALSPQVVRLSPNASARIQCEASGHPVPELVWYRIEETSPSMSRVSSLMDGDLEGVYVEQVDEGDVSIYCSRGDRCLLLKQLSRVTSVSLLELVGARAKHQGQYVCRAENKLGSSQASCIVDVEFKDTPRVHIPNEYRKQTIWLPLGRAVEDEQNSDENISQQPTNAVFKCSIEAGKPEPKVRWLRLSSGMQNMVQALKNLDLYDLSKASSATSRVHIERSGKDLILNISTISVDDEGDYVCLAENEWGRHSQMAKLMVRRPAQIRILQTSPLVANLNSSFQLECLTSGHPSPLDLEWSRFDRGTFFSLISHGSKSSSLSQEKAVLKFDRVSSEDSGEYTCNARDPIEPNAAPLRDVILVSIVEPLDSFSSHETLQNLLPRLIVRPNKSTVKRGANLTLDCLAVSGLQPTIVEWIAPVKVDSNNLTVPTVTPYYRDPNGIGQLLQLGSKLKIINVDFHHEGVYQCKGRNKAGVEVAPALVRVITTSQSLDKPTEPPVSHLTDNGNFKTKLAKSGTNIELKCQVAGEDQVATSWSRNNLELPFNSVQIEHNLWIHNVSQADGGLYLCSARAEQSNKIYHARIQLLVGPNHESPQQGSTKVLHAKIIASKSQLDVGDSVTLECIVSSNNTEFNSLEDQEIEEVFWTNSKTSHSIFLDNVYIQGNLLIVYQIRPDNEGVYRCNYNELSQSVDYRLQIQGMYGNMSSSDGFESNSQNVDIQKVPLDGNMIVECPSNTGYWTRGQTPRLFITPNNRFLRLTNIQTNEADMYQCWTSRGQFPEMTLTVQVQVPVTRFLQRPISYLSFPDTPGAHSDFSLSLKFYPEKDTGLILYSGPGFRAAPADYVSLYLARGYLEFKFELGDGPTVLSSKRPLQLYQWHRVSILLNRFGSSMRLDKHHVTTSNSSNRKYLSLNLDSVLYVGGSPAHLMEGLNNLIDVQQGFHGCMSQLFWAGKQLKISRAISVDVSQCDKPECTRLDCFTNNTAVCQVETSTANQDKRCICLPGFTGDKCQLAMIVGGSERPTHEMNNNETSRPIASSCELLVANCSSLGSVKCQSISSSSYRCLCRLGFGGSDCSQPVKFYNETRVKFNEHGYLKLSLNQPLEALSYLQQHNPQQALKFNGTTFARQISMADSQNISLRLITNSSYGILFYTGSHQKRSDLHALTGSVPSKPGSGQLSKSMVANLLARLSLGSVTDYLALALIDGHVELSYELGSGIAVIRSSQRVNDLTVHQIRVLRTGKLARLFIDELHRYEGSSPGKLSVLNGPGQVYLGGLGPLLDEESSEHNNGAGQRMASFTGCISQVELNSLGPLNLVGVDQLSRLEEARNLAPDCDSSPVPEEHLVSVSSTLGGASGKSASQPANEASSPVDLDDPDET